MSVQFDHTALAVETMRHVVANLVLELRGLLPLVESATVPGRSSAELYVSAAALQVEAKLVRQEKADRVRHAKERIVPPGYAAAPANMRALHVLVELTTAVDLVEASAHDEAQVCRIAPGRGHLMTVAGRVHDDWCEVAFVPSVVRRVRPLEPTLEARLASLMELAAWISDPTWFGWASDHLDAARRAVTLLLAGAAAAPFPGLCPHCDRPTLVRHKDEGLIRCEGDRSTGRKETCLCGDVTCGCVRGVRHEWWQGHTNGWQRLAGQIRHADSIRPTARTSSRRTA